MLPVYVVHLPCPERKAKIAAELARVGFTDITYIHAQEPVQGFNMSNMRRNPRGEFGCALSHLKALALALASYGDTQFLIVEDDVEFLRELPPLHEFPPYFDIVYLGGHPRGPVEPDPFAPWFCRINGGYSCADGYVITRNAIEDFLPFWCDRAGQPNAMYDFILGEFAAKFMGYAIHPAVLHQPPGWSHIGQKHDDKRELIRKGWEANLPA